MGRFLPRRVDGVMPRAGRRGGSHMPLGCRWDAALRTSVAPAGTMLRASRAYANVGIVAGPVIEPDTRIGRYRVIRALGRGGMAGVYEVEDDAGQRFALKSPIVDVN